MPSADDTLYNEKRSIASRLLRRFRPATTPRDAPSDSYVGVPARMTYGIQSPEAYHRHTPQIIYAPSSVPTSPSASPSPPIIVITLPDTTSPQTEPIIIEGRHSRGPGRLIIPPSPSSPIIVQRRPRTPPSRRSQFVTTPPRRSFGPPPIIIQSAPSSPPQVVALPVHPPYLRPYTPSPTQPHPVFVVAAPPSPRSPTRDRKSRGPSRSQDLDLEKGRPSTRKEAHVLEKAHSSPPSLEPETTRPKTRHLDQAKVSSSSRGRPALIAGPPPDKRRAGRSSLDTKVPSSGATRHPGPVIVNLPSPKSSSPDIIYRRPPRRPSPPVPVVSERSPETRNPGTVTILPSPPRQFPEIIPDSTREARTKRVPQRPR